jgi:ElaA protein
MNDVKWVCKHFDELTAHELYAIIKLRNEVFVVEQTCVFQDADDKDQYCYHLCGFVSNKLVAYARLVPAGISYSYNSIGRVITSPGHRKEGLGKALMTEAIRQVEKLFGRNSLKIGAQLYLKDFYEGFGFRQCGEMYLEDGIPHIEMVLEQDITTDKSQ